VPLGPGDVVDGRYELLRPLGGGDVGRVFVAYDRPLDRRVALRLVEPGDAAGDRALVEDTRRMNAVQFSSLTAVPVLDQGLTPDGTRYVAMELVDGLELDQVVMRRAPLPPDEAVRYGVELLDAVLAAGRQEEGRSSIVPVTALVTTDGHIRVARFAEAAEPGPAGAEPACLAVATIVHRLLTGFAPGPEGPDPALPGALEDVLGDALDGRIRTASDLRARLRAARPPETSPAVADGGGRATTEHTWLLWIASLGLIAVLIVLVILGVIVLGGW
jgi:serine/threonine protein kinase